MRALAIRFIALLSLAAALVGTFPAHAAEAPGTTAKKGDAAKPRPIPFHGKLLAVDPAAHTFSVGTRVFVVTGETRVFKPGQVPGKLEDGQVNEPVTGSYLKAEDGRLLARTVYFGGKGDKTPKTPKKKTGDAE